MKEHLMKEQGAMNEQGTMKEQGHGHCPLDSERTRGQLKTKGQ